MSDEQKITDVRPTLKGEAYVAAKRALRAGGQFDSETVAYTITEAIEAYLQASAPTDTERLIEHVRLLQAQPGDVVVFHVRDGLTCLEFDEFNQSLQPLRDHCPGVGFMVAERIDDIIVVRPERQASRSEARMQALQDFHGQVMNTAKEGDVTDGN